MALALCSNRLWRHCLLWLAGGLASVPAYADGWNLCNHTSYIVEAAIGRPDGGEIEVRGWLRLRPGECRQASPAPLAEGYHYVFAKSSAGHRGGRKFWDGAQSLCVRSEGAFAQRQEGKCDGQGMELAGFRRVNMDGSSKKVTRLHEPGNYSLKKAQLAGIQRLLNDAGIARIKISGHSGKTTKKYINSFKKARELPGRIANTDLIDMLESEASQNARNFGMDLCNRTDRRIWTAVGIRRSEMWESRGWWPVEVQKCARIIDTVLLNEPYYIFAEMEAEPGGNALPRLKGASRIFCIAHSKFVIEGNDRCQERFYESAEFVMTEVPSSGLLLIELFEADFMLESGNAG